MTRTWQDHGKILEDFCCCKINWHDHDQIMIMARSWQDHGKIMASSLRILRRSCRICTRYWQDHMAWSRQDLRKKPGTTVIWGIIAAVTMLPCTAVYVSWSSNTLLNSSGKLASYLTEPADMYIIQPKYYPIKLAQNMFLFFAFTRLYLSINIDK
jgi:hypothetical protein